MSDSLTVFGVDYTGVTGIKAKGTGNGTLTYIRPQGTKSITENGTGIDVAAYSLVDVSVSGGGGGTYQAKTNISPTTSSQTITPDSGYDALSSVQINAMPSGTAGTPSATKGSVSNHSVSVTPSVTNSTGYITGGTKSGTAVTVSASELVSGTVTISGSGTTDVTNYASASVAAGGATASATKGTVSNHSVTVTPSVTRTAGYVTAGSSNGTAVTVSASELVSGTYTVDSSGTKDVTNYASASVPSGGATASATKGSVSNHSVSVTPSVTRTAGWVSAGTASGTAVTVSASELVSGSETKTANGTYDVTNLASLVVNVEGSNYIKTVVVPQQTFTPSSSDHQATLTSTGGFEDGEQYLITFDGEEYASPCTLLWGADYCIGDIAPFMANYTTDNVFPVGLIWENSVMNVATRDTSQHTVKVEHLELVGSSVDLVAKTITANGTYNASSDSVDGYSSVTVAIPIVTYHTSSSAPTSSQGSDGDLWLVTA